MNGSLRGPGGGGCSETVEGVGPGDSIASSSRLDATSCPEPPLARKWGLEAELVFLNHGSFGACPVAVLEKQSELRTRMEAEPVRFFVRELRHALDAAREELARFVGADAEELAFVPNATAGVNAVLRSLRFEAGDELLTTNHEYQACRNALDHVARLWGARTVVADIPFPLASPEEALEAVLAAATPRTRLALIDHVTSQTALAMPIERIVAGLAERGIDTLVDGAHAPGMLPVDLRNLGAAYYTANCHKWLCAPKGAGFLLVRRDRQQDIHPLSISHGATWPVGQSSRYRLEFDWTGTDDPTPYLCVPEALRLVGSLVPGGWSEVMRRNRELCLEGRRIVCDALRLAPPAPEEMIGSIASVPLPDGSGQPGVSPLYTDPLQDELMARWRIEVPVVPWPAPPRRLLRISAQLYNAPWHYARLAEGLRTLLG